MVNPTGVEASNGRIGLGLTAGLVIAGASGFGDVLNMPSWAQKLVIGAGAAILAGAFAYNAGWSAHDRLEPSKGVKGPGDDQTDAARRLVQYLHGRWFPADPVGTALDQGYRVSLFTPDDIQKPKSWKCLARTVTRSQTAPWKHVTDREELSTAGIVVFAAADQRSRDVEGIPAARRKDSTALTSYLRTTCTSAEEHKKRTWPYASMAVRVARAKNGPILCVMVVEREDGETITVAQTHELLTPPPPKVASPKIQLTAPSSLKAASKDICGVELQFAADVWAASWDRA